MTTGLVLIHFGEPPAPDPNTVERYLTRIFFQNADLSSASSEQEARERASLLAARRAPDLLDEYEEIGGSPLNAQAAAQADGLSNALASRDYDVDVAISFQFIEPLIPDILSEFHEANVDRLIALPVYPLCGPSTTVASLEIVEQTLDDLCWDPNYTSISGWHRHPGYLRMRANHIQHVVRSHGLDLADSKTSLVFSAHGTPRKYIDEGSRYEHYVQETCEAISSLIDIDSYNLGYQNHENRDIPWTTPDVEDLLTDLSADRIIVEPMSFMHEQSETLVELDRDLAEKAASQGIDFYRVPIPHGHEIFPEILADLVEPALVDMDPSMYQLRQCHCHPTNSTLCLNAPSR